jgi:hypothetical protein
MADGPVGDRGRAVRAQGVGVQDSDRWAVERGLAIEHGLLLQPVIFPDKVPTADAPWHRVVREVPQLGEPRVQTLPAGDGGEKGRGQALLFFQPGVRVWRLRVFQPAIGIGHGCAVVVINDLVSACGGIKEFSGC